MSFGFKNYEHRVVSYVPSHKVTIPLFYSALAHRPALLVLFTNVVSSKDLYFNHWARPLLHTEFRLVETGLSFSDLPGVFPLIALKMPVKGAVFPLFLQGSPKTLFLSHS